MQSQLVDAKAIRKATLHNSLPIEWHVYSLPSSIIYAVWGYLRYTHYEFFPTLEFQWLLLMLCMSIHALLFLVCQWSIDLRARLTTKIEHNVFIASSILVTPTENNGVGAFCKLQNCSVDGKYEWNRKLAKFTKLTYPHKNNRIEYFKTQFGLEESSLAKNEVMFGKNMFKVPVPSFMDLFKEHMLAPFFIFQLFCVCLWFLDDMWYYSLFTLFMLMVFEATVVFQRLKNLQEFRAMSIVPYSIMVLRTGKWITIQTDQLLPGDLCSVTRVMEDNPVPADFILLEGSCIANEAMLSGESTPQLKESITLRQDDEMFGITTDRINVLFGGTKILQVTPAMEASSLKAPNKGCIALVLRTGFATQQGKLVRTIIHSNERVTANNIEALFFILFLLVFAIAASAYVWTVGSKSDDRDRSKLLLHCIMIITSVVPPELPMELSLAVNNALLALSKSFIFCTEPFRIPFAGRIDVACFDKTGTLTAENLVVEGITGLTNRIDELFTKSDIPKVTSYVLAAAHSLVMLEDGVVGDPMEKNTLESIDWSLGNNDIVKPNKGSVSITIHRRFAFSSSLKRMSTVSELNENGKKSLFVATKGAPETIRAMLKKIPLNYDTHYKYWARRGKRVLALAHKPLPKTSTVDIKSMHRNDVEDDLVFVGFLVFFCPLKSDSADAIRMLNESSHRTVMITGDNALTACHIAEKVGIVHRKVLIADVWDDGDAGNNFAWRSVDEKENVGDFMLSAVSLHKQLRDYDLSCTGRGLSVLVGEPCFKELLPRILVYARVSPGQKELILTKLKQAGYITLMCGDGLGFYLIIGTNDVGALKQAHIGVALLDGTVEDVLKIQKRAIATQRKLFMDKQEELRIKWGAPAAANQDKVKATMDSLLLDLEGDVPLIKFGDASVAAPFTSKVSTVMSVCNIVRQGRATLVAMIQMYKILALNSLIMAYTLSVLHLAGIKQGDWQATIGGLMITICFFGIAKSTAVEKLSKERPQPNIFNAYIILSVLGQAAVHFVSLVIVHREAMRFVEILSEDLPVDAKFRPNILNSGIYLLSLIMQISTFAINYQGLPFREPMWKNKAMFNSLLVVGGIAFMAATEVSVDLNNWLQLVPFPSDFRGLLVGVMVADFSVAWIVEYVCWLLFSDNAAKRELVRN